MLLIKKTDCFTPFVYVLHAPPSTSKEDQTKPLFPGVSLGGPCHLGTFSRSFYFYFVLREEKKKEIRGSSLSGAHGLLYHLYYIV